MWVHIYMAITQKTEEQWNNEHTNLKGRMKMQI